MVFNGQQSNRTSNRRKWRYNIGYQWQWLECQSTYWQGLSWQVSSEEHFSMTFIQTTMPQMPLIGTTTLSITAFSKMTLSIMTLSMTAFSTAINKMRHSAEHCYAECPFRWESHISTLCWVSLYWMSLYWVLLCWVSWRSLINRQLSYGT